MKPKIEKVDHTAMSGVEKYLVVAYYRTSDTLSQSNYLKRDTAELAKNSCTVGMWNVTRKTNN